MTLVPLRINVAGDELYSRAFAIAAAEARDLREPLGDVGDELRRAIERNFISEGAAESGRWEPLNPEYARWKEQRYPGRPILVKTGDVRSQALSPAAVRVGPRSMTYTVNSDYAIYHQLGTRKMPQRQVVALSFGSRRAIDRIFAEWLASLFNAPIWRKR